MLRRVASLLALSPPMAQIARSPPECRCRRQSICRDRDGSSSSASRARSSQTTVSSLGAYKLLILGNVTRGRQAVDLGGCGGKLAIEDLVFGELLERHDQGAQRIAVRGDDDVLAGGDFGPDELLIEGNDAGLRCLSGSRRRGGDVEAAAPGRDLVFAPAGFRFILVEACELAIVALVQGGVAMISMSSLPSSPSMMSRVF